MCKLLKVPRSLVYYHINTRQKASKISEEEVKLELEYLEKAETIMEPERSRSS
jgi:hypothetical protein